MWDLFYDILQFKIEDIEANEKFYIKHSLSTDQICMI